VVPSFLSRATSNDWYLILTLSLSRYCTRSTQDSSPGNFYIFVWHRITLTNGHSLHRSVCAVASLITVRFLSSRLLSQRLHPPLFLTRFPFLRSSPPLIPSSILRFSSALAVVSPTSGSAMHQPILNEPNHSYNHAVYSNSLLATLNARKKIREAGSSANTSDVSSFMQDFAKSTSIGAHVRWKIHFLRIIEKANKIFTTQRPTNISIKIDTTQEFAGDGKQDYNDLEKMEVGAFRFSFLIEWRFLTLAYPYSRPSLAAPRLRALSEHT